MTIKTVFDTHRKQHIPPMGTPRTFPLLGIRDIDRCNGCFLIILVATILGTAKACSQLKATVAAKTCCSVCTCSLDFRELHRAFFKERFLQSRTQVTNISGTYLFVNVTSSHIFLIALWLGKNTQTPPVFLYGLKKQMRYKVIQAVPHIVYPGKNKK